MYSKLASSLASSSLSLKIAMLLKDRPTQGKFDHASLVKILKVDRRWHDAPKQ